MSNNAKQPDPRTVLFYWALTSSIQYLSFIQGVLQSNDFALFVGLFLTWAATIAVFMGSIFFKQIINSVFAPKRIRLAFGDSPVPWVLDFLLDALFTVFLFSSEFYITGLAYGAHTFLVVCLRSAAVRYNKGLVQLVETVEPTQVP